MFGEPVGRVESASRRAATGVACLILSLAVDIVNDVWTDFKVPWWQCTTAARFRPSFDVKPHDGHLRPRNQHRGLLAQEQF